MAGLSTTGDALRPSTLWTYWAGTAGCAAAAVWAGMGVQGVIRDTGNCGGRYAACTDAQTIHIYSVFAALALFFTTLLLSRYLRNFCEYPRPSLFDGHQMNRLIPMAAWAIAVTDTVLDIGAPGISGHRTAVTLAGFALVFVILSVDLGYGATRTLCGPLDIVRGDVSVTAVIRAEDEAGRSEEDHRDLDARVARWDRIMIMANTVCVLGGLALGYWTHVVLVQSHQ